MPGGMSILDDDSVSQTPHSSVLWTNQHMALLVSWAERASGYRWLHERSAKVFNNRGRLISIPASIIGYLSGGTILSDVLTNDSPYLRYGLGFLTIAGGILTNLQATLSYKEMAERHRISSNAYASFFRNISAELSLEPEFRANPILYIQSKRAEFDKLTEQSPPIPDAVIKSFNATFGKTEVHKPEITNGLHTLDVRKLMHGDGSNACAPRTIHASEGDVEAGATGMAGTETPPGALQTIKSAASIVVEIHGEK